MKTSLIRYITTYIVSFNCEKIVFVSIVQEVFLLLNIYVHMCAGN